MKLNMLSKKIVAATIFTSALTLAMSQAAMAESAQPTSPGGAADAGPEKLVSRVQMHTEMQRVHDKFLDDTVTIRKELAEKKAVMRALLNAGAPDTVKASQIAAEIFDLQENLRVKAKEAGLPFPLSGMGWGPDYMSCQGSTGKGPMGRHHRFK
ncbi:hypothetical protein [Desulfobulbus oligotrophicus]|uniref:Periplasmic heavy metal sensor n=1 Tax=Desulfobulbus oligotrophicus TaxID=1909699 RepID=A0A7T5VE90_9BACT|nr:hypothetical protein [Desulfobulbus oligotrophicus]QQG66283.1 hypothetical protein HP555_10625 [Desulfobulbus oligotrophicus]